MKENEKQWSSATPGLLIILLDQSGSMLEPYCNNENRTTFASKAVNRVIDTIIQKNFSGTTPKNRCFISVLGYNHSIKEIVSGYLSDLDANPIRVDTVKKKVPDGAGGLVEIDSKMPIWVDPITEDGSTNMKGAFELAKTIIEKWIKDKPESPAPVIINISDGVPYYDGKSVESCMDETLQVVNQIKDIVTDDGHIQIFNAMIGEGNKVMFPCSKSETTAEEAQFLFDISTEIPESYEAAGIKNFGEEYENGFGKGARGAIYNADAENLIKLIDFGSSKGIGDK